MDNYILNIKTFVYRASAPNGHTVHKTMREPRQKRGQALVRESKPPPDKCSALSGLLNVNLMAVDFTNYRETDRHFSFYTDCHKQSFDSRDVARLIVPYPLVAWQCYIAKYP